MANTVSATITDLDGQAWIGGTYIISFVRTQSVPDLNTQTVFSGSLDSGGAFSVSLPKGSWNFNLIPNASQGGFSSIQSITANTDLTATLSALAYGPRFNAGLIAYGYADGEVLPAQIGQSYFNVISNVIRTWNGSAWQSGGSSGSVTTVSVVSANGFAGTVANATTTPAITLTQSSIGSAVTGTTQATTDNSTKIATTAFVHAAIAAPPLVIYSAAGTALPAASSGLKGAIAIVSDATTPTFLGAYASGGAVVSPVMCNGTAWVTV